MVTFLRKQNFLKALCKANLGPPPIWLMRQAGRYLPKYRKIREKTPLIEMFHSPQLIVETTLLPFEELELDAAILFADLLTVCDGMGIEWSFLETIGPVIANPLRSLNQLKQFSPKQAYFYLEEAIKVLKQELSVPLLGFSGGPFTIASYLIEGKSDRDLKMTKQWLYRNPVDFKNVLEHITNCVIDLLKLQVETGVEAIQLFDTWACFLSKNQFKEFSLPYLKKIITALSPTPIILYARGSCFFANELASALPQAISFDWVESIGEMRKKVPHLCLQGNLDPTVLLSSKEAIEREAGAILKQMSGDPGFVFNLGHGILPSTPLDNVKILVDYVHNYS